MAGKRGLGRGLNDLIPTDDDKTKSKSASTAKTKTVTKTVTKEVIKEVEKKVKLSEIEPNQSQPRRNFNEDSLAELADSIKQFGIIEPLIVTKKEGYYELIAGERRWRAARLAGLKEVPVVIKDYSPQEVVEIALIENLQREDLNPIEEAIAYERLISEFKLKQDEVAERVSKSRSTITNALRLLKLDARVQQMLIDDMLTTGHVRSLISIEDPELQYETALLIFDRKMSVRETEKYVKQLLSKKEKPEEEAAVSSDYSFLYNEIEENLKNVLGTKAKIKFKTPDRGKIEIDYYSSDDLDRIVHMLYNAK